MAYEDISIEDYREQFEGNDEHILIDVREIDEFEDVRIPDTINIPLSEFQTRYTEVPSDKPVILVCKSGGRSAMAGDMLSAQGYDNLYNLLEGTMGWVNRDLPTEEG